MKSLPRCLSILVCSVVLSAPACSTLEKPRTNQQPQLKAVHQVTSLPKESQIPATQITVDATVAATGSQRPWPPTATHFPLSIADRVKNLNSLITCFMPDCF